MNAFLLSLGLGLVLTPLVAMGIKKAGLLDVPNERSSHSSPTPRGGGLAVAVAAGVGLAVVDDWTSQLAALLIGALLLGAVGLVDDRVGLGPRFRLAIQLATPLVGAALVADRGAGSTVVVAVLAAVVVAGYVNAFNFMDGINGISASQAAVAGAFLAIVADHADADHLAVAGSAVCGASLGFLPYNAVRPRLFLGDVGSYFLGFWLAVLALLVVDAGESAAVVVAPFLLYLADTMTTLVRRWRRGARLTEAHREHTYQRLTQLGWSHVSVALLCAGISLACSGIMLGAMNEGAALQAVGVAAALALVVVYLVLPGLVARRTAGPGVG